jgi:HEAT repeat protein
MSKEIKSKRVHELVSVLLDRRLDRWARIDAAKALAATRDPAAAQALGRVLADIGEYSVIRESIAQAVGEQGDVRVLDAVIRVAGNPDEPDLVRTFAIQSLGGFDDARAMRALVDVLRDDEDPGARRLAASTLGQKGGREAVGPLIRAVSDRDSRV